MCTGNLCRSPLLEHLLDHTLNDETEHGTAASTCLDHPAQLFDVTSAGTDAIAGESCAPPMFTIAEGMRIDQSAHRARAMTLEIITGADLVVTAAREHRAAVSRMLPRAARRTFTALELARIAPLVTDDDLAALPAAAAPDRLQALVPLLAALRGTAELPTRPSDDDIVDPYGHDIETYAASASQAQSAVQTIATLLRRTV